MKHLLDGQKFESKEDVVNGYFEELDVSLFKDFISKLELPFSISFVGSILTYKFKK